MTNTNQKEKSKELNQQLIPSLINSNNTEDRLNVIFYLRNNPYPEKNMLLKKIISTDSEIAIKETSLITLFELGDLDIFRISKNIFNNPKENASLRARTIWVLSKLKSKEAFDLILEALDDNNEEIVFWAIMCIIQAPINDFILTKMKKLFTTSVHSIVRQIVACFFGSLKNNSYLELLEERMLLDNNYLVRLNSIWAINYINEISSMSNLIKALQNETHELNRREIALAIGLILESNIFKITDAEFIQKSKNHSIKILTKFLFNDSSYIVRRVCAESLGRIKDKVALSYLINALSTEINQFVRKEIIIAIGKLGDKKALDILNQALKSHYKIIVEAAKEAIQLINKNSE